MEYYGTKLHFILFCIVIVWWWINLILWWFVLSWSVVQQASSLGFKLICVCHYSIWATIILVLVVNNLIFHHADQINDPSKSLSLIQNNEFDNYLLALLLFDCISFVLAKTARELVASILHPNCSYFVVLLYEFQFIHIAPSYYGNYQITFFYFTTIYSLYFSWYSYYFMYF